MGKCGLKKLFVIIIVGLIILHYYGIVDISEFRDKIPIKDIKDIDKIKDIIHDTVKKDNSMLNEKVEVSPLPYGARYYPVVGLYNVDPILTNTEKVNAILKRLDERDNFVIIFKDGTSESDIKKYMDFVFSENISYSYMVTDFVDVSKQFVFYSPDVVDESVIEKYNAVGVIPIIRAKEPEFSIGDKVYIGAIVIDRVDKDEAVIYLKMIKDVILTEEKPVVILINADLLNTDYEIVKQIIDTINEFTAYTKVLNMHLDEYCKYLNKLIVLNEIVQRNTIIESNKYGTVIQVELEKIDKGVTLTFPEKVGIINGKKFSNAIIKVNDEYCDGYRLIKRDTKIYVVFLEDMDNPVTIKAIYS